MLLQRLQTVSFYHFLQIKPGQKFKKYVNISKKQQDRKNTRDERMSDDPGKDQRKL